ncbi:DNA-binding transcriptional regulator, LysR family [Paenibacillus sophorae]|uniref:DNA-binding transcriptional regulator, LysR family n=1 Tax=Paenibacillus sophorae TaxID=1333845 RepID=A0A1H8MP81_9BACL|nr:LysR family transcriptional regulator [Paenibacillus sophorae]QWU17884.1 LysR family transcriptional regulator [Paenibacillus sophorae]SEO18946.1 DNA-binding transcriptional regulator, LysR family [Paenibacillus sophorae]
MVDFEWYRSFCMIYKHNSVSEAAKARIMTQPAMSQHLASLEAEVGEVLFVRTSRKMFPTERGKELYSQLAPLIESLEETTMSFRAASLPTLTVIKIGAAHEFYTEKILPQLHKFNMSTITNLGTADQLVELLKEDKLDLIITSKRYQAQGIEYLKLMDEEFVIVAPSDCEIPDTDYLESLERWLSSQNWISYGLELPIIRRIWREHFKKRPQIRPIHIIPDLHLILKAIENGAGLSVIPTYLLRNSANEKTKVICEDLKVKNELYLAYKLKHKHLPQIHEMMTVIRENV